MKLFLNLLVAMGLLIGAAPPVAAGQAAICGESTVYLPLVLRGEAMANINVIESIEALKEKPARTKLDGIILAIFEESATIQMVGSSEIRANVALPQHVKAEDLQVGQHVRMGHFQGQPIVLAVLDALDESANYSGLGYPLPTPPQIHVTATRDGWVVEWAAVAGADRYHVYRNDDPDATSPDDLGYITATSLLIPYESPFIYFAVAAVSGLNESEVSGWVTDDLAPPVPDTFVALNAIDGHQLVISGDDGSLTDISFKCWEIQMADDDSGTNATSLGYFYLADFPYLNIFSKGTIKYYRIRSIDWAGNASDWTAWDQAVAGQSEVQDKFDNYGGDQITDLESLYWLKIADFDTDENWTETLGTLSSDTTEYREGDRAVKIIVELFDTQYYSEVSLSQAMDLSSDGRFGDNDYVVIPIYTSAIGTHQIGIAFRGPASAQFSYSYTFTSVGWNYIKVKKSDFTENNSPDWADIDDIYLIYYGEDPSDYVIFDDWRIVKADPDDATDYNDTGQSWDKAANTGTDVGEWHVYPGNRTGEPNKSYSYGQIKTAASPSTWYLSHKPLENTDIYTGQIQAGLYLKEDDGLAGLAFFVKDVTAGSWDMYVLEADSSGDTITLAKYVGGTRTQIAQASFTFAPDQILWLGADFKDYDSDAGRIKVYASLSEGNLIQAANLILSEQDDEWLGDAGGSVGVLSKQANVRFVNFTAGSPAHAETADVAFALDGPLKWEGLTIYGIDTTPTDDDTRLLTSGGVYDHTTATDAVHGLGANEHVLGSDTSGEKVEHARASKSGTAGSALSIGVINGAAVTFPLAFSATPAVVVSMENTANIINCNIASVTTTGFTPVLIGVATAALSGTLNWIAKGS